MLLISSVFLYVMLEGRTDYFSLMNGLDNHDRTFNDRLHALKIVCANGSRVYERDRLFEYRDDLLKLCSDDLRLIEERRIIRKRPVIVLSESGIDSLNNARRRINIINLIIIARGIENISEVIACMGENLSNYFAKKLILEDYIDDVEPGKFTEERMIGTYLRDYLLTNIDRTREILGKEVSPYIMRHMLQDIL